MMMKNKAFQYLLRAWGGVAMIAYLVMFFNLLVSGVIMRLTNQYQTDVQVINSPIDFIALIIFFVCGLAFFKPSFKYLLANGVSRRSFFVGNIPALAIVTFVSAIVIKLLQFIFTWCGFWNYGLIFGLLYKGAGDIASAIWVFALLFVLAMLGWFINLLYYRSGTWLKVLISVTPLLLLILLSGLNRLFGGAIFQGMGRGFMAAMGFSGAVPNPYTAIVSMVLLAVILGGFIILLLWKAQLKD